MDLRRALETAEAAAVSAGEILRRDFHPPGGPRGHVDKAEADPEAEAIIPGRPTPPLPPWGDPGEETGRAAGDPAEPIWVVDPNDGTRDYLKGLRGSAVSIALVHEGRPVLGMVHAFASPDDAGDRFAWAEGEPAPRRNGRAVF